MPERFEVLAAIDGELEYAEARWRSSCAASGVPYVNDALKPTESWLMFIRGYYNDLVYQLSHMPAGGEALDVVRKLAGLCVSCMQHNGIVTRDQKVYLKTEVDRRMVYAAIQQERVYQEDTWPGARTLDGEALLFGRYLHAADVAWSDNPGDEMALDVIRKLAGIAVRCLENHGCPLREPFDVTT